MTIYHVEMKKASLTYQFVSGNITEKAMFKWVYETIMNNGDCSVIIYYPTQRVGSFNLYNELGKVRPTKQGIRFYPEHGKKIVNVEPNGNLDWDGKTATRRK